MKWLIYGSKGWIGQQLLEFLNNRPQSSVVQASGRADNSVDVENEIRLHNPDVVFSCIGRTHGKGNNTVDYLEDKVLENIRDNLYAPLVLAETCKRQGVYFVYIGTGCIYEYDQEHTPENQIGFEEDSEPNFFGSSYSIVKGFTDKILRLPSFHENNLNVRIRMPINGIPHARNFVTKIASYAKVIDIPNSVTVIPSLLGHLVSLVERKTTGTINLVNPGSISHNEILEMYKEIVDNNFTYTNFAIEEQNTILRSKRSNNILDTSKLQSLCGSIPDARTAVRDCLLQYKEKRCTRTILVTGGYGFIGSNMIRYLYAQYPNDKIVNVDDLKYSGDSHHVPSHIRTDTHRYKFERGDICDVVRMTEIFLNTKADIVIHFAAETHVDKSFDNSLEFTRTNVLGTHTLLQVAMSNPYPPAKFIHISTDEVYGDIDYSQAVLENNKLNPTNPYAATKAGAESIVISYQYSFGLPCVIVRCNNVYGPNQNLEKLIPKFITQALTNVPMTIHGSGNSLRSYIHVDDVVCAIDTIMKHGAIHSLYNIGIDTEFSVNDVYKMIASYLGISVQNGVSHTNVEDRKFNDKRYYINSDRLRRLGWAPTIDFSTGLLKTIQWYKDKM